MLNNYFDISLNTDQQKAVNAIDIFLNSDKRVFILKGYAGTGKTTLLKGLGRCFKEKGMLGQVMAPTGRAAKVIESKTSLPATTIHKAIFCYEDIKPIDSENEDAKKSFKFYFDLAKNDQNQDAVFIVDEASMIGDNFSEGEFMRFGSGHLLSDLLKYMDLYSSKNHKIIFIGDSAQLEPYGDSESKALNEDYFIEKEISVDSFELTTVIRQQKESGILANATYFRELLKRDERNENKLDLDYDDIEELAVEDVAKKYTEIVLVNDLDIDKAAIITFSNQKAFEYNVMIREYYFPYQLTIVPSDILLVTKNSYNGDFVLMNGEIVQVISVSDEIIEQKAPVMINNERKQVCLQFRQIEIKVPNQDAIFSVMIIEDHLNSKYRDLDSYQQKALYINFVIRFRDKYGSQYNEKSKQFKEALKSDPFFNALQVKYGYAITCHKSQGGEWENVFVDFANRVGLTDSHLRWCYTAITRAEKKLYVLNQPNLQPMSSFKISSIGKIGSVPVNMFPFDNISKTPFHDSNTHPAKRLKYFEIEDKLRETEFSITNVEVRDWLDMYHLHSEDEDIRIDALHNNSGFFTHIKSNTKTDRSAKVVDLIKESYEWKLDFSYQASDSKLNFLYQKVCSLLEDSGVKIMNIDEGNLENYYITYYFKTDADCAYIQFYFNSKGQITRGIAKSTLGQEDIKLSRLIKNLNN